MENKMTERYEIVRTWKDGKLVGEQIVRKTISGDLKKAEELKELPKEIKERIEEFVIEDYEDKWREFRTLFKRVDKFFDELYER